LPEGAPGFSCARETRDSGPANSANATPTFIMLEIFNMVFSVQ
jgi:hypothetical protein